MNRMSSGMNNRMGMNNGMGGGMNMGMNNGMGVKSRLGMRGGMGDYSGGFAGPGKFASGPGSKGFRGPTRNEREGKAKGTSNHPKGKNAKKNMNKSADKTGIRKRPEIRKGPGSRSPQHRSPRFLQLDHPRGHGLSRFINVLNVFVMTEKL